MIAKALNFLGWSFLRSGVDESRARLLQLLALALHGINSLGSDITLHRFQTLQRHFRSSEGLSRSDNPSPKTGSSHPPYPLEKVDNLLDWLFALLGVLQKTFTDDFEKGS